MKIGNTPPASVSLTPVSGVQTQLDGSTRESLSRLASLIRSQQKASEDANAEADERSRRDEEDLKKKEERARRASQIESTLGEDESILREVLAKENYPSVERVAEKFREAQRTRGVRIYSEQKSKDAVALLLNELDKASRAA